MAGILRAPECYVTPAEYVNEIEKCLRCKFKRPFLIEQNPISRGAYRDYVSPDDEAILLFNRLPLPNALKLGKFPSTSNWDYNRKNRASI